MEVSNLIGMKGGKDAAFFEVLAESGRGKTKYYPSVKYGSALQHDHPEYWQHKVTMERETIRMTVAGNAVCAESAIANATGCKCMAVNPCTVDIYTEEAANV